MAKAASIAGISGRLGVKPENILVLCCFCRQPLSTRDKAVFDFKKLGCFVREGKILGACEGCCLRLSTADCLFNSTCTLELDGALAVTGKTIQSLTVRCVRCMGKLTYTEKVECALRLEPLHLVRHCWRGHCRLCTLKNDW
ncbi:E6 [Felis catus papillomavirus type 5]|uniref:Protein E6 n=1 Tax=Felis catus papillomavirus type 5 TaxID=2025339 RepID=A0A223FRD6_9PAPI|nr:E6 [Felis catus papillomavirus type 5]AST11849.1 E6 [Felis catus papillomavirus type 5]